MSHFILVELYIVYFFSRVAFFFFKQKTAYEMRISDWSSDVCSSDLIDPRVEVIDDRIRRAFCPQFENETNHGGQQQDCADPAKQHQGMSIHVRRAPGPVPAARPGCVQEIALCLHLLRCTAVRRNWWCTTVVAAARSEEHTSELQSLMHTS